MYSNPYASDPDPRGTCSEGNCRLPPLREILGDILDRPLTPRPSRRALSDWRTHSTPNVFEHGPESNPMAQDLRYSSPNSGTYPSSGSNIPHLPLSDGRRIHSTPDIYEHGPESDPMAQELRHFSPNNNT